MIGVTALTWLVGVALGMSIVSIGLLVVMLVVDYRREELW